MPQASGAGSRIHAARPDDSFRSNLASDCGHTGSLNSFNLSKLADRRVGVASYRAYFLNSGGHIVRAVELACDTDDAAAEAARRLLNGQPIELWERARMVARLEPAPKHA